MHDLTVELILTCCLVACCLLVQGGDDTCSCEDFTEPVSRESPPDWIKTHNANVKRIDSRIFYDVVFLGDELVEEMNGTWLNKMAPDGIRIQKNFESHFGDQGELDGLALGIKGDMVSEE
jgi:hypothetical protein